MVAIEGIKRMVGRTGRPVRNQWEFKINGVRFFKSYKSLIAGETEDGKVFFSPYHNYSVTTRKYLRKWLADREYNRSIEVCREAVLLDTCLNDPNSDQLEIDPVDTLFQINRTMRSTI